MRERSGGNRRRRKFRQCDISAKVSPCRSASISAIGVGRARNDGSAGRERRFRGGGGGGLPGFMCWGPGPHWGGGREAPGWWGIVPPPLVPSSRRAGGGH